MSSSQIVDNSQIKYTDDPVFYGPDGKIITEEESNFLSSNNLDDDDEYAFFNSFFFCRTFCNCFFLYFTFSNDEIESDPEMDQEMRIAFKDFIKGYAK